MRTDYFKAVVERDGINARIMVSATYDVEDTVSYTVEVHENPGETEYDFYPEYDVSKMQFTLLAGPFGWRDQLADIFQTETIKRISAWPLPEFRPEDHGVGSNGNNGNNGNIRRAS